jgi:hypothetical protein
MALTSMSAAVAVQAKDIIVRIGKIANIFT